MNNDSLAVIWLSTDKRAAADMAFLYIRTSILNHWWKNAELILWGPSVEAAASCEDIQIELMMLKNIGVDIKACEACAVRYGVLGKLQSMGIECEGMSEYLTQLLKERKPMFII